MNSLKNVFAVTIAVLLFSASYAFSEKTGNRGKIISRGEDGSVCYELDVKDEEGRIQKTEALEKAGKLKEAFELAEQPGGCMPDGGYERMFGVMERTHKPLGQQAEKAGRLLEAHKYYVYPFMNYFRYGNYRDRERGYSLEDAHRTRLAYAQANRDDFKIVKEAVEYFQAFHETKPRQTKDAYDLARQGGEKQLRKEANDFKAKKYDQAMDDLTKARPWFDLIDENERIRPVAQERANFFFAQETPDAFERGFSYYYEANLPDLEGARARAGKLGERAERKGDYALAERFYYLADDSVKKDAMSSLISERQEKKEREEQETESKRQDKFQKDQRALEKELGF